MMELRTVTEDHPHAEDGADAPPRPNAPVGFWILIYVGTALWAVAIGHFLRG